MNSSCFACVDGNFCTALMVGASNCRGCAFYKTKEQAEADERLAYEKIAAKPRLTQLCIASKYYHGKMPWNPSKEVKRYARR